MIQQRHEKVKKLDFQRAGRFSFVGLTLHGPFFLKGYGWLDRQFGAAKTLQNAVKKSAVGQVTIFPVYVSLMFMYLGLLEGRGVEGSWQRLQQSLPKTLVTGTMFWPAANVVNFMMVPPTQRVLFANAMGVVWNTVLSWIASSSSSSPSVPAVAVTAGSS